MGLGNLVYCLYRRSVTKTIKIWDNGMTAMKVTQTVD